MASMSWSAVPSQASRSLERLTVTVEQALDPAQVDVVRAALSFVLAGRPAAGAEIVLEMSCCDFVDGTGYCLLCETADLAQERGYVLHLTGVRPEVVRVLALLDRVLGGGVQRHVVRTRSTVPPGGSIGRRPQHALVRIGGGSGTTRSGSVKGAVGDAGDGVSRS